MSENHSIDSHSEAPAPASPEITFASLQLAEPLQRALAEKKYTHPSPIQAQAIPLLLEKHDLIGCAQTGTGKTAAFALPILHHLDAAPKPPVSRRVRSLILTPTRELAAQIGESFRAYGKHLRLTHTVVFGGVGQTPQVRALHRGVDILIATPGRLLDLVDQGHVKLDEVEIFVLDEADRMLDMGFIHDVKKIIAKLPARRQTLFFSATMPPVIQELANTILTRPKRIEVTPVSSTAEKIDQHLCHVDRNDKAGLLVHLIEQHKEGLILVFVRMKHGANRLVERLEQDRIRADAIHGNKSQGARQRALEDFRTGKIRVLVATDIAARGIDVKGISLVVNFDLPEEPEAYVHRIGRTARAGAEGKAISFCDRSERGMLRDVERLIRKQVPVLRDHPFAKAGFEGASDEPAPARGGGRGGNRGGNGGRSFGQGGGSGGGQGRNRGASQGGRSRGFGGGRPSGQGETPARSHSAQGHSHTPRSSSHSHSHSDRPQTSSPRPQAGGEQKKSFFGFGFGRKPGAPTLRN